MRVTKGRRRAKISSESRSQIEAQAKSPSNTGEVRDDSLGPHVSEREEEEEPKVHGLRS